LVRQHFALTIWESQSKNHKALTSSLPGSSSLARQKLYSTPGLPGGPWCYFAGGGCQDIYSRFDVVQRIPLSSILAMQHFYSTSGLARQKGKIIQH